MDEQQLPPEAPLVPEVWVLACADAEERNALKHALKNSNEPYVAFRWKHKLLDVVAPTALASRVASALNELAPVVHLFHDLADRTLTRSYREIGQAGDVGRIHAQRWQTDRTGRAWPEDPNVVVDLTGLSAPDRAVQWDWLWSGRTSRPAYDAATLGEELVADELKAFATWSGQYVERWTPETLDKLFGPEPVDEELPAAAEPAPVQERLFKAAYAQFAANDSEAREPLAAKALDGADAKQERIMVATLPRAADDATTPGDDSIEVLVTPAVGAAKQQKVELRITVPVTLWASRRDLVIALRTRFRLPVLFHFGDDVGRLRDNADPKTGRLQLSRRADAPIEVVAALKALAENTNLYTGVDIARRKEAMRQSGPIRATWRPR